MNADAAAGPATDPTAEMLDLDFIAFARMEVEKVSSVPTIEEVRRRLSKIDGPMAEFVIAERGDY